jgi:hypothetical protein
MGSLTDRLNSVQRRTTWRMSHDAAIINIETSEDSLEEKVTYCNPVFFRKGQIMMIINMKIS